MKCSFMTISTPSGIQPDVPTTQDWKRPTANCASSSWT